VFDRETLPDPAQLLDVEMQQVAGARPLTALHRERRLELPQPAQALAPAIPGGLGGALVCELPADCPSVPRSRDQIVQRVLTAQETAAAVAAAVGVSERTVRKWMARFAAEAEGGLADRSCRPGRSPGATPPLLVSWVAHLRRQRWTGAAIAQALDLSPSTVARLLLPRTPPQGIVARKHRRSSGPPPSPASDE